MRDDEISVDEIVHSLRYKRKGYSQRQRYGMAEKIATGILDKLEAHNSDHV